MNLLDQTEAAETARLKAAKCEHAGCLCGVEMWRLPGQSGHVSRSEALAWLEREEGGGS